MTGGGSGIGEAVAVRFAEEGARVAVLDVDVKGAELTATLCGGLAVVADVSDSAQVDAAVARVERELGPVDILVNNAGIAGRRNSERLAEKLAAQAAERGTGRIVTGLDALVRLPDDEWRQMFAVHVDGTFYCSRAVARSMKDRGTGAIVNVASICGVEGCTGHPHYSAAKGAVLAFSRALAKELVVQGIRVNAITPGFIETPATSVLTDAQRAGLELTTPIGRLGRPEEIAATVAFLASDDASFSVGSTFAVNGGLLTA
ncbi:MAG TPA: SDR family NAD(P)-dependent oxidoreductase [Solirubrobacteraceae bacterium]